MKFSYFICLISLSVAPAITMADGIFAATEATPGQFYAGFSLLKSDADCNYHDVTCEGSGYKLATGYRFNDNLAVEGGYYDLFSNDGNDTTTGEKIGVNGSGLALSAIGSYSVDNKRSLFGKAGIMAWDAEASRNRIPVSGMNGTDILLGVGAGYKLSDHWQLRGEYERVGGDLDASMYSLGTTLSTL